MKKIERKPTDKMYAAGMQYLNGKSTNWCVNDLFKAMWDAAPQVASDACIGCNLAPIDCPCEDTCGVDPFAPTQPEDAGLMPCPCGGEVELLDDGDTGNPLHIECKTPWCMWHTPLYPREARDTLIKEWNTRTPSPSHLKEIAELKFSDEIIESLSMDARTLSSTGDGYLIGVSARINKALNYTAELRQYKSDMEDQYRQIMAEECAPDEHHCTCTPLLRKEIKGLRRVLGKVRGVVNSTRYDSDCLDVDCYHDRIILIDELIQDFLNQQTKTE